MNKRIFVLSPHADDAEIGCGGYIARSVAEGAEVMVALATVGPIHFLHLNEIVTTAQRLQEFNASMDILGVKYRDVLTWDKDSKLNTFPQGDMVAKLDALQEAFKPTEVLIPLPSAHQDHRYCWEVGIAATRPSTAKHQPSLIAAYEYPLTSWGDGASSNSFRGGMYVDVGDHWETKLKALSKYHTQMRGTQALISESGVESLAKLRGVEAGFRYAELLHILRLRV